MKPILLLATAACLSGMAASPEAEAQNMPFRSSLHDAALREALGDSVLSLAQTAGAAEAGSPWSQWHVRHVRLSALEWGKKCCGTMRPASARAKAFIIVTARSHRWLGPKKPTLPWAAISRTYMAYIGRFICAMATAGLPAITGRCCNNGCLKAQKSCKHAASARATAKKPSICLPKSTNSPCRAKSPYGWKWAPLARPTTAQHPTSPWTLPLVRRRGGHVWKHCSGRFFCYTRLQDRAWVWLGGMS